MSTQGSQNAHSYDIPLPIVSFGRWVYVVVLSLALLTQQPLITTAILLVVLPSVFLGPRYNLIGLLGKQLFAKKLPSAEREDYRLIRFNNAIALSLLTAAQGAFLLGSALTGWIFIGLIIVASAAALAGFCLGCVLYYRFKLYRYKFLGEH
jgi:Domain of unknown function (DUF4395)